MTNIFYHSCIGQCRGAPLHPCCRGTGIVDSGMYLVGFSLASASYPGIFWRWDRSIGRPRFQDSKILLENSGCSGFDDDIIPTNNPNCNRILRTIELQSSARCNFGCEKKGPPLSLGKNTWHSHHHHQQHRHCFFVTIHCSHQ